MNVVTSSIFTALIAAIAIFVPLWTMIAILGAGWEQPDNKKVAVAILALGAAWVAITIASQHLRLAGRRTTPAKAFGIVLIVTLGCCWALEYWLGNALLSVSQRLLRSVGWRRRSSCPSPFP